MDAKEKRKMGINVVILGKGPQLTVFQIYVSTCDSVQRNLTLAICTCRGPFLLNQNLQSCHPGFWKSSLAPSLLCYYAPYN